MAKKSRIWDFFDGLKGDKVVWMIVIILIMISGVCIFSSTSMEREVLSGEKTRIDVALDLMKTIVLGVGLLLVCYNFFSTKFYRILAQAGFIGSLFLLAIVVTKFQGIPFFKASTINGAWRVIKVGGLQIHIYEVIKVAMVLYLAWAVDEFNNGKYWIADKLSKLKHMHWLAKPFWQKAVYIYIPMLIIMGGVAKGSGSSALFIFAVMAVTILVGGLGIRDILPIGMVAVGLVAGVLFLDKATDGAILKDSRLSTWKSRLEGSGDDEERFLNAEYKSDEWYDALDKIRQPYSAKIAIHEGGLIGKGPGQSTQRYVVPVMYEDYMFSFIVEEYGLWGGIIVIILYVSLLARGSLIARNCKNGFGKITIAGLVLMITGQAMLHMLVNEGIGPLTGQTLPLISYGTSSFLMFCIAFGIILSISRESTKDIDKQTRNAEPLVIQREGIQGELDVLDSFDSGNDIEEEI